MRTNYFFLLPLLLFPALSHAVDFQKEVWPILEARCIKCHGEDKQKGDLRLDQPDAFIQEMGFSVLEHSDEEESLILERITLPDGHEERMPLKGEPLTSLEIRTLREWITAGCGFGDWPGEAPKPKRTPEWIAEQLDALDVPSEALPAKVEFNRDIRPVLANNCYKCHGFDKNKREAKLRLDVRESVLTQRSDSAPIVPNNMGASSVMAHILSDHVTDAMPPLDSDKKLNASEKALIARWIEQGAEYQDHWAFIPPTRPKLPKVQNTKWIVNPIDTFVLAKLEENNLSPSPPEDKRTLLRRVTFDTLGLPAAYKDVRNFEKKKGQKAYGKTVNRLLSSEHYGERMAVNWLDLVRYADTNGYHSDEYRSVWPYRDYVINAFNSNMPFDQFTIEQLAGDLLPDSTVNQKIASGYNRLNQISSEGGVQPAEYVVKYASDRVRTTSTVFLGITMGCTECHDHKFDPFTQKNFYQFSAFFADLKERGKYEHGKYGYGPFMRLSTPEQEEQIAEFDRELKELRKAITKAEDESEEKKSFDSERKSVESRRNKYVSRIPSTLISLAVEPHEIRILPRGNWLDHSGEIVTPGVPARLPELNTDDHRATRLDLARWMVSEENPLTARVFVNRLWKQFFGTGLSKVLDDVGAQGEWPSHPELLDWLAIEFMDSDWDIKYMVKLITTSNTYQQSSMPVPATEAIDPYNRLLARQNRIRLEAEQVRDNALAVSGLYVSTIGGRSVYPYQPDGYYQDTYGGSGPGGEIVYPESSDENQYRRGLYTMWRRSYLHPSMMAFDAPSREECTAERPVSNIPQQALVLLNDPTYVEAARVLAEGILSDGKDTVDHKIALAYQRVLARNPSEQEQLAIARLYEQHAEYYRANSDEAEALVAVGHSPSSEKHSPAEIAAWTSVARVLLNVHETITRI